jgi:hypothetical protein
MTDDVVALQRRIRVPAQLTTVGLWVMAALSLAKAAVTPVLSNPPVGVVVAVAVLSTLTLIGWLVTASAFITWLYLVRENLELRGETGLLWRKGWTIGGWFIPVANLVIPWRVVCEVYARSVPGAYRTWTAPRLVSGWWVALILAVFRFTTSETVCSADCSTRIVVVHFAAFWNVVNGIAGVVAAVLAVRIVSRVTAWHAEWQRPTDNVAPAPR